MRRYKLSFFKFKFKKKSKLSLNLGRPKYLKAFNSICLKDLKNLNAMKQIKSTVLTVKNDTKILKILFCPLKILHFFQKLLNKKNY